MRKYFVPVIAVFVAVSSMLPSYAFSENAKPLARKHLAAADLFGKKIAAINPTPEQKDQLRKIFASHEAVLAPKLSEYIEKRRMFRKMSKNVDADQKEIYALAQQIGQLKGDIALEKITIMKEIIPVLTPEQAAKFKSPETRPLHGRETPR